MATIDGARALGMDKQIGSLEVGKAADIIAVRVDTPRMTPLITRGPLANLHHNLVHAVQGGDVDMTMVGGRVLVENGQLRSADLDVLITEVNETVPDLFARRKTWLDRAGVSINELDRV
jgi:5-methylthioadenosine/S-adenosylhomocysteine deaminase